MDGSKNSSRGPAPAKKRKKKSSAGRIVKGISLALMAIILIGMTTAAICGVAFAVYINKYISPEVDIYLEAYRLKMTSFIYTVDPATGQEVELQKLYSTEDRVWADIDEIPKQLKLAFISVEDNRFEAHNGVDWRRTIGAGLNYVVKFRDNFGGGSTITQQLIKNLTGEDETSVKRKIQEVMRALELEKKYEKDDILEMYLNTIYFGQSAYGVKQAAQTYFGKEMSELTLAECAAIAGITKNPYKYDIKRFPEFNEERRAIVLGEMLKYGNITQAEYDKAMKEKVVAINRDDDAADNGEYQSYYIDAVINAVLSDIQTERGYSELMAKQLLFSGGLKIVIPIDLELQAKMDEVFQDTENFPGGLGEDGTYPQASMVIMDPYTGKVLAMYGGRGEKYGNRVLNRATMTYRQPGSCIKPITVYAPAIEYGFITPISVVDDAPVNFTENESGWPKNENRKYSGLCTIYRGIASSLNTVAVSVVEKIGYSRSFNFAAKNLGLTSLVTSRTVTRRDGSTEIVSDMSASPLALGGMTDGVSVLEMSAAYSAFVNDGSYTKPILYTKVYNNDGSVLLDKSNPQVTVAMETRTRTYMIQLLTNVVRSGTGTKAKIEGIEVGGKTGTTTRDNDRWFAGITPYYAGVVWFGYDKPQSLQKFSTNPALELWHRVMEKAHEGLEPKSFEIKSELENVQYCMDSGLAPGPWCALDVRGSRVATAKMVKGDRPKQTCGIHVGVEIDPATNMIANEYCPVDQLKVVGAVLLHRAYPYSGVAVADQAFFAPYDLTEGEIASKLFKPTTPTMQVCAEHHIGNDGNIPVTEPGTTHPDDSYIPYDPFDPNVPTDPEEMTEPTEPTAVETTEAPQ